MSDGLPTERQLAELEQRVLTRIHRRAAIRGRVASGVAAVALVVGAVVLVHPTSGSVTGASSGSGAGAASSAEVAVRCHTTSAADSSVRTVPLPARPTPASIAAACEEKFSASGAASGPSSPSLPPWVVCRTSKSVWEVFPDDGHPSTLCARNGLTAG